MFTGLIEEIGVARSLSRRADVCELVIAAPRTACVLKTGDSVSVSGACSTVTSFDAGSFSVQMMPETLARTKLGSLKAGSCVNLERAMRLDARLDGHIVAGHVDGVGRVTRIEALQSTEKIYFSASRDILSGIVEKGSITIDGVSLTVIEAAEDYFSVGVIPTTLRDTTLGSLREGESVNIETDIMGKYINKFLAAYFGKETRAKGAASSLTWDKLGEYGWN